MKVYVLFILDNVVDVNSCCRLYAWALAEMYKKILELTSTLCYVFLFPDSIMNPRLASTLETRGQVFFFFIENAQMETWR